MSRLKRWMAIPVALMAVAAFALPAMASASYGLEQEAKPLAKGTLLKLVNDKSPLELSSPKWGVLTCPTGAVTVGQEVTENGTNPTSFSMFNGGAPYAGSPYCRNATGGGITMKNLRAIVRRPAASGVRPRPAGTAEVTITFQFELAPGGVLCSYQGSSLGNYVPGSSLISVQISEMSVTPAACGTLHMAVSFSATAAGKPVILN